MIEFFNNIFVQYRIDMWNRKNIIYANSGDLNNLSCVCWPEQITWHRDGLVCLINPIRPGGLGDSLCPDRFHIAISKIFQ